MLGCEYVAPGTCDVCAMRDGARRSHPQSPESVHAARRAEETPPRRGSPGKSAVKSGSCLAYIDPAVSHTSAARDLEKPGRRKDMETENGDVDGSRVYRRQGDMCSSTIAAAVLRFSTFLALVLTAAAVCGDGKVQISVGSR